MAAHHTWLDEALQRMGPKDAALYRNAPELRDMLTRLAKSVDSISDWHVSPVIKPARQLAKDALALLERTENPPTSGPHASWVDKTELAIVRKLLEQLISAGYLITINDDDQGNGDDVILNSVDIEAILAVMFSTEGDLIKVRTQIAGHQGTIKSGWVRLIYGNSTDVVCDWTTNLTPQCDAALAAAEEVA